MPLHVGSIHVFELHWLWNVSDGNCHSSSSLSTGLGVESSESVLVVRRASCEDVHREHELNEQGRLTLNVWGIIPWPRGSMELKSWNAQQALPPAPVFFYVGHVVSRLLPPPSATMMFCTSTSIQVTTNKPLLQSSGQINPLPFTLFLSRIYFVMATTQRKLTNPAVWSLKYSLPLSPMPTRAWF